MRKALILFIFITTCTISYGQYVKEKTLIGKWSVTKVTSPIDKMNWPASEMKDVIEMKKAFHNAVFEFKKNGDFFSKFAVESSYSKGFKKINGKNWKFTLEEIIIGKLTDKGENMTFYIKNHQMTDFTISMYGLINLHMKKGVFKTDIDYDSKVATVKTKEKSIEEKRKDLYGDGLMELGKANEARNAISNKDIKYIDGIAYFKDSNSLVKLGKIEERDENGKLKMEGWFLDGKKDEVWTWYYENGKAAKEKTYVAGKLHGLSKVWNENGELTQKTNYKNGIKVND